MDWLWWILGGAGVFIVTMFLIGLITEIFEKKNSNMTYYKGHNLEFLRIYNEIDEIDVAQLKDIESKLSKYGTHTNRFWAFTHPEWDSKDFERERNRRIEGGPICGCITYGEAAELYEKVLNRLYPI